MNVNITTSALKEKRGKSRQRDYEAMDWVRDKVRGLTVNERMMLQYLASRCDGNHKCFPSQRKMVGDLEVSRSTITRMLTALERKGLISRKRRLKTSALYTLNVDSICVSSDASICVNSDASICVTQKNHKKTITSTKVEEEDSMKIAETANGTSKKKQGKKPYLEEKNISPDLPNATDVGSADICLSIPDLWAQLSKEHHDYLVCLTNKERGQLQMFAKKVASKELPPSDVLSYVVKHWESFADAVAKDTDMWDVAKKPCAGTLLNAVSVAINMYRDELKPKKPPLTVADTETPEYTPPPTPTPDALAALAAAKEDEKQEQLKMLESYG